MEKLNLDSIWTKCVAGDRKAQFQLYQQFSSQMFTVCLRYAQHHDEAEDILQMGFIKVFSKCTLFDNKGSLEGWIRRIMVNTAIEIHRRNKKNFFESLAERHEVIPANTNQQDGNLHYQDLMKLVHSLPLGYRTVFNMYAIEGYSHKEIAEMLSISEGNSKSQLSRARQWLKDKLVQLEKQLL
ncbi:RNA polymerase sigma factor [Sphingobacterium sp. MYb382]|uniref:RNA polymerase sigma factor n=1 Tax=Sphingobacterium sp. MYb382 TaxID=2745278 RepID=UPI0030A965B7